MAVAEPQAVMPQAVITDEMIATMASPAARKARNAAPCIRGRSWPAAWPPAHLARNPPL